MGKYIIILIILAAMLSSCEKSSFEIPNYDTQIVVDGKIEQNQAPIIFLTYSAAYFSDIDSASLRKLVATRAKVTIDDGTHSEVLTLRPNKEYFPPYYYTGIEIKGEVGKTYSLTVELEGKTLTAETTIPEPVKLDSVWFEIQDSDTTGFIYLKFKDNADEKNYYRTYTRNLNESEKFVPTYVANYDDRLFNGEEIEVALYKGNLNPLLREDPLYFKTNQVITLKACSIDKASFDFWYTMDQEMARAGNPFASSNIKVKSNIVGGLGIWAGYGVSYYDVVTKEAAE